MTGFRKTIRLAGYVFVLGLGSCGGGGESPAPIPTESKIVTAASVPAEAVNAVAVVASGAGEGSLGSKIALPAKFDSFVLGLDENGRIVLAGLATSQSITSLSSQTTALALVRMAIGRPPVGSN